MDKERNKRKGQNGSANTSTKGTGLSDLLAGLDERTEEIIKTGKTEAEKAQENQIAKNDAEKQKALNEILGI
jgi:hypothetical protein